MRTLETERLLLRPFTLDNVAEIHRQVYSDPIVCEHYCGKTRALEETRQWIAYRIWQLKDSQLGFLAVERKADRELLGLVALQHYVASWIVWEDAPSLPFATLEVELTYALGRAHWKQGYATEACRALIDYAFRELRIPRLAYAVSGANPNSYNLMRRLGFRLGKNLHPDAVGKDDVVGVLENTLLAKGGA
jgi:RimJ/RimL family protein N-acetyltransferase